MSTDILVLDSTSPLFGAPAIKQQVHRLRRRLFDAEAAAEEQWMKVKKYFASEEIYARASCMSSNKR